MPFRGEQRFQNANGRNRRRGRQRGGSGGGPRPEHQQAPPPITVVADSEVEGWYDQSREGGFIRRASASYLPQPGDPFVPPHVAQDAATLLSQGQVVWIGGSGHNIHRERYEQPRQLVGAFLAAH